MKLQLTYQFDSEDELRAHLGGESRVEAAPAPVPEATPTPVEATPTPVEETKSETDVDIDGMPYDKTIHASPAQTTADGRWRSKRGKGDEAKQARADFLAKGGDIQPPADLPTAAAAPTMPGMPSALPAAAPEPVSLERVIERITTLMQRNALSEQQLAALYERHGGSSDPSASFQTFSTNESARASLFAALAEFEG